MVRHDSHHWYRRSSAEFMSISSPLRWAFCAVCVTVKSWAEIVNRKDVKASGRAVNSVSATCTNTSSQKDNFPYRSLAVRSHLQYLRKGGLPGFLFPFVSLFLVRIHFWSKVVSSFNWKSTVFKLSGSLKVAELVTKFIIHLKTLFILFATLVAYRWWLYRWHCWFNPSSLPFWSRLKFLNNY